MIGSLLGGRYRVINKLGEGGFGHTYIVEDTHRPGNPQCVLKHLKPASNHPQVLEFASKLFNEEAKVLEQLGKHPQIPQLLAYFEEKKEFYLVQELIVGHSLDKEIALGKSLSYTYVIRLLHDILETLAFVHQNRVIHRDIKPQNLMRRKEDDKIILIDFGAVKKIRTTQVITNGKATLSIAVGTPGYIPSEQAQGRPRYSSDIYAVGMLGIFALTGTIPEQDSKSDEIVWRNHIQGKVPDKLLDVLEQMVRYDFRQRYPSAVEAFSVVQELFSDSLLHSTIPEHNAPTQPINVSPPPVLPQHRIEIPVQPETSQFSTSSSQTQELQTVWSLISKWLLAGILGLALVLCGALLIYGILLLLVWLIPALPASQILPQYPTMVILWISIFGICLIITAIRSKKDSH